MSKDIKTAEELAENLELLLEALVANTKSTDINLERLVYGFVRHLRIGTLLHLGKERNSFKLILEYI